MFDDLLFPTDGSDGTERALDHVLDIAAEHDATVHVLNVADVTRDSVAQIEGKVVDALVEEGEGIVQQVVDRADQRGVSTVTAVKQGEPYPSIVDYAANTDVDLVVMPTHGRKGLSRLLLGSTTERVVRESDVPVLTIGPDDTDLSYPYEDVLVPTDGSESAGAALTLGIDLTAVGDGVLHLLSVAEVTEFGVGAPGEVQLKIFEEEAAETVEAAAKVATEAGVEQVTETSDVGTSVHRAILSYIEKNDVDVVVAGTHGRTGFDRYMLGSVTEKLVRTAPVPVLTVRKEALDKSNEE